LPVPGFPRTAARRTVAHIGEREGRGKRGVGGPWPARSWLTRAAGALPGDIREPSEVLLDLRLDQVPLFLGAIIKLISIRIKKTPGR
jgi:hypothetical protein